MNSMFNIIILLIVIKILIKLINNLMSTKNFMNNLECGFNNMNNYKINFSMNFTFILIIFIMFDIEMMMIVPLMMSFKLNILYFKMINIFIMFMMSTTLMEMKNNKIIWLI